MVKVKLFGLLRLDTGLKELELEADSVKGALPADTCGGPLRQARHLHHRQGYRWLHSNDKRRTGQKE